jgi:hypothetical protein
MSSERNPDRSAISMMVYRELTKIKNLKDDGE